MTSQNITKEDAVTPVATAFTVSAPKLRRMLTAVLPHAADDDTLPALMAVKVEVTAGVLYLVTTDRFTIAAAREEIPGAADSPVPDAAFLLPLEAARALRRTLKGAGEIAALTVADDRLTVDCGRGGVRASWAIDARDGFPLWRPMLRKMITAPQCEMGDGFALDPRLLAKFTVGKPSWAESANLRITNQAAEGKDSPLLVVTRGGWFVGCQMPRRVVSQEDGSAPSAALAAWAAATAPAQKAEAA